MNFDKIINKIMTEDNIPGGKADKSTPESIAKKHNVSVDDILYQIAKGIKVEYEHTNDKAIAKEIAMDHLEEFPDYYDRLDKMEKEAKKANKDIKEEMTSAGVTGTSGYGGGGIAAQDDVPYAKTKVGGKWKDDSRVPTLLFKEPKKRKKKGKEKKQVILRRPKIGM